MLLWNFAEHLWATSFVVFSQPWCLLLKPISHPNGSERSSYYMHPILIAEPASGRGCSTHYCNSTYPDVLGFWSVPIYYAGTTLLGSRTSIILSASRPFVFNSAPITMNDTVQTYSPLRLNVFTVAGGTFSTASVMLLSSPEHVPPAE